MKGLLAAALIALSATPALASTVPAPTKGNDAETYKLVCYTTISGLRYCTREIIK